MCNETEHSGLSDTEHFTRHAIVVHMAARALSRLDTDEAICMGVPGLASERQQHVDVLRDHALEAQALMGPDTAAACVAMIYAAIEGKYQPVHTSTSSIKA